MKKSRKFISMPIISLDEGIQIGAVRNLIVNPEKMEVAAITIDQRGWFRDQKIIPYSKVKSVGDDAITIDQSSTVQRTVSFPEILKLIKEKADPIGTRVLSENGTVLGVVDEYYIDEGTGRIVSMEISGKFLESLFKGKALLSADCIRTMGFDAIVVKAGSEEKLDKIDGGLQETFSNIKEGTSTLLESTIQRTKEISKNLKEKYDKKDKNQTIEKPPSEGETLSYSSLVDETAPEQPIEPDQTLDKTSTVEIKEAEILPQIMDTKPLEEENNKEI